MIRIFRSPHIHMVKLTIYNPRSFPNDTCSLKITEAVREHRLSAHHGLDTIPSILFPDKNAPLNPEPPPPDAPDCCC